MDEPEKNQHNQQAILQVNGSDFFQVAYGNDYVLYQAGKKHKIGESVADLFLEKAIDKGWWGAIRLEGRFRMQIRLDQTTLFPTPEIAHQAIEEFFTDEHHLRAELEKMRKNKLDLQTFQHVPPRPPDIHPEIYFSPALLKLSGIIFTLYHLTQTEAGYRTWEKHLVGGASIDLRLAHVYRKGWQAVLLIRELDSVEVERNIVEFEPEIEQLFSTPEKALEILLTFIAEEENVRKLLPRLRNFNAQERMIMRNEVIADDREKSPLRINERTFVWQKWGSLGDIYQEARSSSIRFKFATFKKGHIQLINTNKGEWLGKLQFQDILLVIYFEKVEGVGFPTSEEALAAIHIFTGDAANIQKIYTIQAEKIARQCITGEYGLMLLIRGTKKE